MADESNNLIEYNRMDPIVSEFAIDIEELEGGEQFNPYWKKRIPFPFEIVCCDRGRLPYGSRPYSILCEIPGCAQGAKVTTCGRNKKIKKKPEVPKIEEIIKEEEGF